MGSMRGTSVLFLAPPEQFSRWARSHPQAGVFPARPLSDDDLRDG